MIGKLVATMALFMAPVPALAQDSEALDIEGWLVAPVMPEVCQTAGTFKGDTILSFIDSETRSGMIALVDNNWKLVDGTPYEARISWDNWKTSRTVSLKAGQGSNGLWTISTLTDRDFGQRTREAKGVAIRVAALNIDGAVKLPDAVLAALTTCIRKR